MRGDTDKRILVIRTDGIGDVILTTPLARAIKRIHPRWHVTFLVREEVVELVECITSIDDVLAIETNRKSGFKLRSVPAWSRAIRSASFDVAIAVSPNFPIALAVYRAGVPVRIGTGYRAWSVLFNRRIYHHRKVSEKHEVEYNFDLLEPLGVEPTDAAPKIQVPDGARKRVGSLLEGEGAGDGNRRLIAIHPGSGGSSAAWPLVRFTSLVDLLEKREDLKIILTGSEGEKALIDGIVNGVKGGPLRFDGRLSLVELAALYRECDVVVTNSTGPLHLAMAVDTPVVGLFCNLPTCRPVRWGPYGKTLHRVITPEERVCAECIRGGDEGECMGDIAPTVVMDAVYGLLK